MRWKREVKHRCHRPDIHPNRTCIDWVGYRRTKGYVHSCFGRYTSMLMCSEDTQKTPLHPCNHPHLYHRPIRNPPVCSVSSDIGHSASYFPLCTIKWHNYIPSDYDTYLIGWLPSRFPPAWTDTNTELFYSRRNLTTLHATKFPECDVSKSLHHGNRTVP